MDEIIMITTKKAIYMKRVVMEDLALMVSPQQRPQALGPRQQHNNSKQHIFSSPQASPSSSSFFLTSDHVMLKAWFYYVIFNGCGFPHNGRS